MSALDACIAKYLETKGFESAARSFRRESSASSADAKHNLNDIISYYRANVNSFPEFKPFETPVQESTTGTKRKFDDISTSEEPPQVSESARVFLGNLSFKVTEEAIKRHFASFGEVLNIDWVTDKVTGNFYGSAFVTFDSFDTANKAMAMNGLPFMHKRPLKMNLAAARTVPEKTNKVMPPAPKFYDKPDGCRTLFMGNLAFEITEEMVREFFGKCGPIYEVRFQVRENGEFKGVGFIEFEHESSISDGLKLHAKKLCGRPVRLDFA